MNLSLPQVKLLYHLKTFIESDVRELLSEGFKKRTLDSLVMSNFLTVESNYPSHVYKLSQFSIDLITCIEGSRFRVPQQDGEDFFEYTKRLANRFKSKTTPK